jgi:exopolysaccharide biosynthesis polyprenyl glycosylphosphotransferase
MAVLITLSVTFATGQLFFSRFVLLFAMPATAVALALWHRACRSAIRSYARRTGKARRTAFYGCGRLAADLALHMENKAAVPCRIIGFISPVESSDPPAVQAEARPGDLAEWLSERNVEQLVIADTTMKRDETADVIWTCEHSGLSYMLVPDAFALVSLTTRVTGIGGTTLIQSVPSPLRGFRSLLKRALDLSITLVVLPLLLVPGLVMAAAILIDSGRPVFYTQVRLGKDYKKFRIVKFRSMRVGADREKALLQASNEATGPLFKMKSDPRITRVGRVLRRWSLDELPQLFNVLTGQMSLVGPRPPLPEEVELYTERQLKRLQTIPGITGVWQVSGRSQLTFDEMVKLDLYYVDNWSIWLDISILLLTVPVALSRKGAY